MSKLKPYLVTGAIVVVVLIAVFRFGVGRKQIIGAAA
jgi:hypothetical protein